MKKSLKRFYLIPLKIILYFVIITVTWVILYRFVNPPITPLMVIRYFESDSGDRSINKEWKDYEDISENMALAVIAAEDQKFFQHNGFDVEAIQKAIDKNEEGGRIKGASTISQQVAKNAFLWPERSWLRKGLEAYFTFLIETFWSKERILEVYLNVVEMGDGIYGTEAASQKYFGKPAKNLTRNEAALIAAVLPDPKRMSPTRASTYVYERQRWIVRQMRNLGSVELIREGE
jgi:monofunctional biosynthetic peptidoglycan transglycosylase